jgi:subtilase family serine protease
VTYQFVSWSDNGAATHAVTTPAADGTFTATYEAVDGGTGAQQDPDLTAALASPLPAAAIAGAPGRARVRVTNAGAAPITGAVNVRLFASPDPWLDPEDTAVTSVPRTLTLRPGASRFVPVRFAYPDVVEGGYYLLAYADSGSSTDERDESNNVAAGAAPVTIAPAFVDLSASFLSAAVNPANRRGAATLLVRNAGNAPASGILTVALAASTDATADPADAATGAPGFRIKMKAGASKRIRLRFVPPATLAAGQYYLTATLDPNNGIGERDEANNTAVSANPFTVG